MRAPQRTVIVGASSGIGAALALELARRGDPVAIVARRAAELERVAARIRAENPTSLVTVVQHDAADIARTSRAWDACERGLGGTIERLVYAAGIMPRVREDEYDTTKDASMVAVNLTGAMAWMNIAAARFLTARAGQIVGISSVAGERGRIGAPAYSASKAALTSFLESLRNRLDRHGISVITVKPGFVDTDMLKDAKKAFGVMPVEACATVIANACDHRRQSFYVPLRWGLIMCVIRSIPSFIFRRLRV